MLIQGREDIPFGNQPIGYHTQSHTRANDDVFHEVCFLSVISMPTSFAERRRSTAKLTGRANSLEGYTAVGRHVSMGNARGNGGSEFCPTLPTQTSLGVFASTFMRLGAPHLVLWQITLVA